MLESEKEVLLPAANFFGSSGWEYTKPIASPIREGMLWKPHLLKIGEKLPEDCEVLEPFIRGYGEVERW
jgi:hypothetical protein